MYKIKEGYKHRENPIYCDNTTRKDHFQLEVYQLALTIAKIIDKKPVLDIGCGSGYKLVNLFNGFKSLGVDLEPTYNWLVEIYFDKCWQIKSDIPPDGKFGVVICADVIEHVIDPDEFIGYLMKIDFDYLVLSTPDRSFNALSQDGPPNNTAHVREWTKDEFYDYVSQYFDVVNHYVTNKAQCTQCMILKHKADE